MSARLSALLVVGGMTLLPMTAVAANVVPPTTKENPSQPTVQGVKIDGGAADAVSIRVAIPNFTGVPALQVLDRPNRIVMDLPGTLRGQTLTSKEFASWQHPLVLKRRLAQYITDPKPITRMVLEVPEGTKAEARVVAGEVILDLHTGDAKPVAAPALFAKAAPTAPVSDLLPEGTPAALRATASLAASANPVERTALTGMPTISGGYQTLPVLTSAAMSPVPPVPPPAQEPAAEPRRGRAIGELTNKYTGAPINIELKADFMAFLRTLVSLTGMNMMADDDLENIRVDIIFKNTPWDQVLDLVCRQKGLGKTVENGIIRVAKIDTLKREEDQARALEEARALSGELVTHRRALSFAKAEDVAKLVEKMKTQRGTILVDARTNTLFITDLPKHLPKIDEFITTLDVSIPQVAIEAKIVEANIGWDQAFGVKWPTANSGDAKLQIGGKEAPWINQGSGAWNSLQDRGTSYPVTNIGIAPGKDGVTSISGAAGEAWLSFISPRLNLNVILQAAESEGTARIVSNPKVTTQNNQKGTISAGEKIPYPAQQGGASGGAISVTFAQADLKLDVTPQITSDGTIIMDLKIDKSEADFSRQVGGQPTIITRELSTRVLVPDGGTAVLGGVYIKRSSADTTGVPFLRKLPVLGGLFRSKHNQDSSKELLIFITPRIVKN